MILAQISGVSNLCQTACQLWSHDNHVEPASPSEAYTTTEPVLIFQDLVVDNGVLGVLGFEDCLEILGGLSQRALSRACHQRITNGFVHSLGEI